ncbi:hypothetical protein KH5H1_57100 [Corallococcus caeni]|nr:hypothetical protein KH5H1_57100 [Corallococcus sp. KH5-1]
MPQADASRFFLRLLKATALEVPTCREDFLSECRAPALAEDEALARWFALFSIGERWARHVDLLAACTSPRDP